MMMMITTVIIITSVSQSIALTWEFFQLLLASQPHTVIAHLQTVAGSDTSNSRRDDSWYLQLCTGCGRKNTPIWEGHSFGWGACHRTAVYVPFSVYTMAWLGEHRAFIVEEFIKNGGSLVATQRAFRIRFALGRQEAVPDKKTIYRWVSNLRQTRQTLEALKEAIR